MPITLHGVVSVPADNGSNATNAITITPPAGMVAGDAVVVYVYQRGAGAWSVTNSGGQTFTLLPTGTFTNISAAYYWAIFDGTWDANPVFTCTAATNTSARMLVFRPSAGFELVYNTTTELSSSFTTTSPFTAFSPGINLSTTNNLCIASWQTADDNTWGSLAGAGWVKTGLAAQYRNVAGTDSSATFAWMLQSGTGQTTVPTQLQLTLGADASSGKGIFFYEQLSGNVYNDSTILSLDSTIDTSLLLSLNTVTTLSSNNVISVLNETELFSNLSLSSQNQISALHDASVNNDLSLQSDNQFTTLVGKAIDSEVSLVSVNIINNNANLTVNPLTNISADSQVNFVLNISMNSDVSLITEGGFNEADFGDFSDTSIFISEHNISITGNQIAELAVLLAAASQLTTVNEMGGLFEQVSLDLDNQILFNLFVEAYTILTLNSEAVTTFEALNVLSALLTLNIDATILLQISNIINSAITISSDHILSVMDELVPGGNIYNEAVILLINAIINFNDTTDSFMKIVGALFIKNINTIK